ncbi:MAG: PP2C family protein-serine/threonine phosphatase [Bdellovibrionota bacterium]
MASVMFGLLGEHGVPRGAFDAATTPGRNRSEEASESRRLLEYTQALVHSWSATLAILALVLVPVFIILDYFMMPPQLLTRFAIYRMIATVVVIIDYIVLRNSVPSRSSYLHGYVLTLVVGGAIVLMTSDLGGFNSTYYAGLNLVMIAVTILLPWGVVHSAVNAAILIGLYVLVNALTVPSDTWDSPLLINNLYFLCATAIISVSINYVKQQLIRREFFARADLEKARDALWGEMEVAKRIQTSLLPRRHLLKGYTIAATMIPAAEVGGDYYDIIEAENGDAWLAIGDVSGHGVESGLIMMMTQTAIFTAVNEKPDSDPSYVLEHVNAVIKKNVSRLGTDRYMTITLLTLRDGEIRFAGRHQDILVYRSKRGVVEVIPTDGAWLGVVDDLRGKLPVSTVPIDPGDMILLYTDGVTEAADTRSEMYGEERLAQVFARNAQLDVEGVVASITDDVRKHMQSQADDLTIIVLKRT